MYNLISCAKQRGIQTCNFSMLEEGCLHPDRVMDQTHDLLYILDGGWEVWEEDQRYQLRKGDLCFLHGGRHHYGKTGCLPGTRTMFLHCDRLPEDAVSSQNQTSGWDDTVSVNTLTHCRKNSKVEDLFKEIIYNFYSDVPHVQVKLFALLLELFYELSTLSDKWAVDQMGDELVNEIIFRIRTMPHISYTLQSLAEELYVCPSTLSKRFKRATGVSVYQYQLRTKLEMAKTSLVTEQDASLKEIAASFGFCDEFHFSKLYKKRFGISPSQSRRKALGIGKNGSPGSTVCGGIIRGPIYNRQSLLSLSDFHRRARDTDTRGIG